MVVESVVVAAQTIMGGSMAEEEVVAVVTLLLLLLLLLLHPFENDASIMLPSEFTLSIVIFQSKRYPIISAHMATRIRIHFHQTCRVLACDERKDFARVVVVVIVVIIITTTDAIVPFIQSPCLYYICSITPRRRNTNNNNNNQQWCKKEKEIHTGTGSSFRSCDIPQQSKLWKNKYQPAPPATQHTILLPTNVCQEREEVILLTTEYRLTVNDTHRLKD
jgi:hypothetical protein